MAHPVLNTHDYTIAQLILFGVAALFWILVYIIVIIDIFKYKFVGIPALAVCANFAWEILWSIKFYTNMGALFEWGYRCWAILDVFIFYSLFRYGKVQFSDPLLKKGFPLIIIFAFLAWVCGIYALTEQYPDPIGAVSAYLVNINMSAIYILLIVKFPNEKSLGIPAAWYKMFGTALTSLFCFWVFPQWYFMLTLATVTFLLDIAYIVLITALKKQALSQ